MMSSIVFFATDEWAKIERKQFGGNRRSSEEKKWRNLAAKKARQQSFILYEALLAYGLGRLQSMDIFG